MARGEIRDGPGIGVVTATTSDEDQIKLMNNRQNGRRRGRGGQQVRGGQPGGPDRGSRLDNRARGNAAQLLEKYKSLARDAQMQGDRVNTEYYLQFADHYFRVLSENRVRFEEQRPRQEGREDYGQEGDEQGEASPRRHEQRDFGEDGGWQEVDEDRTQPERRRPAPVEAERRPRRELPVAAEAAEVAPPPEPRAEGERRPRRNSRLGAKGANGTNGAHAGDTPPEENGERIELDRLPGSITTASAANTDAEATAEEAPRPRRRAPRRPRAEAPAVDA